MPEDSKTRRVQPFAEFLAEHRKGKLHQEVGEALNELVEAVQSTGSPGQVTLVLTVKPSPGGATDMVIVQDDVRVRRPTGKRPQTVFFIDPDYNLSRHNPAQPELPLRTVQHEEEPVRPVEVQS